MPAEYHVSHLAASGDVLHRTTDTADPFVRQTRCLLMDDHLFERGQAAARRLSLEGLARIVEMHPERRVPNTLRASVRFAEVTRGDRGRPGSYYHARYEIRPLPLAPVTLSLPVGGGNTEAFGDFSDYEGQPFRFDFAYDPWSPGFVFLFLRDTTPFPDDSETGINFCRALGRSRWKWEGIHLMGRNHAYAQAVATQPRTRPGRLTMPGRRAAAAVGGMPSGGQRKGRRM